MYATNGFPESGNAWYRNRFTSVVARRKWPSPGALEVKQLWLGHSERPSLIRADVGEISTRARCCVGDLGFA